MRNFKIVSDSSSDMTSLSGVNFLSSPLKIITADCEYTDDSSLDVEKMVNELLAYSGRISSSCPNTEDWLSAFGDAEEIFCITISGSLSGSYASAVSAKEIYEENYPDRRVFVLNSLSVGPEMKLIIEKVCELLENGSDFETICKEAEEYSKRTGLFFMLESMKNLANNGRISPLVAKAAGVLGIKALGKASDEGELASLAKFRGDDKAIRTIIEYLTREGFSSGKIKIAHVLNEGFAKTLAESLEKHFGISDIDIYPCRGLCSFYAEKGGIVIGFEK